MDTFSGAFNAAERRRRSGEEVLSDLKTYTGALTVPAPATGKNYGAAAPRPLNSRLSPKKLVENGFRPLPPWQDALERYLKDTECEQLL